MEASSARFTRRVSASTAWTWGARLASHLTGGKAAVGVLAAAGDQAYTISLKLTELGGTVDTFNVTEEDVAEVGRGCSSSRSGRVGGWPDPA